MLANSVDPNEMPHTGGINLDLTIYQTTCLWITKWVNMDRQDKMDWDYGYIADNLGTPLCPITFDTYFI